MSGGVPILINGGFTAGGNQHYEWACDVFWGYREIVPQ
jgi:hypothetical protein